jgi:hypothetical protein
VCHLLQAMSTRCNRTREDCLPDARDGLTRLERIILYELSLAERERSGRRVLSAELYGRVVEHINVSVPEFQTTLRRLVGR